MQKQRILTVHPKTKEEFDALKAFMKALKINFEESHKEDVFELSEAQKKILEERLKADKKDFIPAQKALNKLRQKYEL
ncbi:MAG TPA: DUF2683 family protein [Flavobacteriaceae bacterium]|nr:DUF2683 family protein [Flavobacteriaceae bacterium]